MRWLRPTPVLPAITAGTHPPLGVTDTTQPLSSAASIEVVPAVNWRRNSSSRGRSTGSMAAICAAAPRAPPGAAAEGVDPAGGEAEPEPEPVVRQRASTSRNGFFSPWNGYGSPGPMVASFLAQLICLKRSLAYAFDRRPLTGSAGGTY